MGDPTAIAVLEERIESIKASVEKVLSKLEDNGKEGLVTRMGKVETRIGTIEQQHAEEKETAKAADARRKKNQDQVLIGILFLALSNVGVIIALVRHAAAVLQP